MSAFGRRPGAPPASDSPSPAVRILLLLVGLLLVHAFTVPPVAADTASELEAARSELAALEREADSLAAEFERGRAELDRIQRAIRAGEQRLRELEAELDRHRTIFESRAREFYKHGSTRSAAGLSAIMSFQDPSEYSRAIKYLSDVQSDTRHALEQFTASKADVDAEVAALRDNEAAQTRLLAELEEKKERVEASTARQQELVKKFELQLSAERSAARAAPGGRRGTPGELAGYGNGRLPDSVLDSIGIGDHRLWTPAAAAFRNLYAAAQADGVDIGVSDSYRSYEAQVDVARRKGLYGSGGLAARPGTSNHGWGLALDLQLSGTALAWMRVNARTYGFYEDVPRETWHWTYYG